MVDREVIETMLRLMAYLTGRAETLEEVDYSGDPDQIADAAYLIGQRDCARYVLELITE